ncbi:MAG TPA: hypothetical protein VIH37_09320 [Candidatus Limnocylindrales bacterium]
MLSGDDLATALTSGGSNWMVLSVAAVLPIIWAFTLSLHFARPYVLRFLQKLTLRFGGDVWWLSYVLFRDGLLVVTLCLSVVFLFPNVYLRGDGLGITAPLATLVLFWATLVKLIRDPDDNPSDWRLQSVLLVIASVLYIVPQVYGVEAHDQNLGDWSTALVSVNNLDVARVILWTTLALFAITGAIVFIRFLVRLGSKEAGEASSMVEAPAES